MWWHDGERTAAENLAFDEALLDDVDRKPVIRFYRWSHQYGESWTMGYFQRWREMPFASRSTDAAAGSAHVDAARRWTGGGLVCHQGDLPYTLAVPAEHWLAKMPATDCYQWIHKILATAIRQVNGIDAIAMPATTEKGPASPSQVCFTEPVHWDVVLTDGTGNDRNGQKIAGAAQRRSRGRLLHQGSVILPSANATKSAVNNERDWRQAFALLLCNSPTRDWFPGEQLIRCADVLARDRYSTQAWREKF